ncbi:hypothetical protein SCOR_05695 [Sulfidibacter corallicola]|uniref:Transposase n=1 Tax=Sulfidibacter corallicola TaxID=2818388 RepID=A0A8A4TRC4_SULCO|nr:hypothetical protein [Sulfidibacter corallicola]QTD51734.1 hypothetical protein J3U87_04630 [Sulfidibacter corallicola]
MSNSSAARAEKRELWQSRIEDWQASELNQSAYCRQHGLALPRFQYGKRRFSEPSPSRGLRLVPIKAEPGSSSLNPGGRGIIRLHAHGYMLEIEPGSDVTLLAVVLDVLGGR